MARTVALVDLRAMTRQRSDMENATDRFSDAEVNSYIYQSWCALYDYLTSKGQDYYLSTQPVYNTALNTDTYALPLDYYKVRGVDVTIGGFARSLSQWRFEERERYNYYGTWNTGLPIRQQRIKPDPLHRQGTDAVQAPGLQQHLVQCRLNGFGFGCVRRFRPAGK